MTASVEVRGHAARQGEGGFALIVVRLREPVPAARAREVLRYLAPILAQPDSADVGLDAELEDEVQLIAAAWAPPEAGHAVGGQRRLIDGAGKLGVAAAWFLQTGTYLEEPSEWTTGPPPSTDEVRFAVDGYPEIVADFDPEGFGIACKLAGPALPGIASVLRGLHALWLAPYAGHHGRAAVVYDRARHAAQLWVGGFAAPCRADELVGHVLWIAARLDEIVPVVHARFAGTSEPGGAHEPFVLGGNPLRAIHARGGEDAVDAWIEDQQVWSPEELARMLRELAIELVTAAPDEDAELDDDDEDDDDDDDDDFDDPSDDEDDGDDEDDEDDEAEGNVDEDRGRHITRWAGDLLIERARAGKLDPRAVDALAPLREVPASDPRQPAIAAVLDAARGGGSPAQDDEELN